MTTILVIEDETHVRDILSELLTTEKFDVLTADNGRLGYQLAQRQRPDLILCDIMMPELDGYGVLTQLKKNPITDEIPFIFLSAKADRLDFRVGMDLGADDYLTKPFTRDELLTAVRMRLKKQAVLARRHQEQLLRTQSHYQQQLEQAKERLNQVLSQDQLTGLLNQLRLRQEFERFLKRLQPLDASSLVPLVCVGVERLREINAELGYSSGDHCLQVLAQRLQGFFTQNSPLMARLNGNEFVLVLTPVSSRYQAQEQVEALFHHLSQPISLNQGDIVLQLNLGIAFYPRDAQQLDPLLHHSQQAREKAQSSGGSAVEVYSGALRGDRGDRLALEQDLRRALETPNSELLLVYQPQVHLDSGEIYGVEALMRWHHPQRGSIPPNRFIPIAEESDLIIRLGEWVLETACHQAQLWEAQGLPPLRVAVNLSARQFEDPQFYQRLVQILRRFNRKPGSLELELTETCLVRDPDTSVRILNQLKALGVSIAIDDFGTGFSSLSYLQRFPFDMLKIDRCFVAGIHHHRKNAIITEAVIEMAHKIGLMAIAEGIETPEERACLQQLGCDQGQGYFFHRPLPAIELSQLLRSR
ncbi:GGDEF domain-containing response regulator [Geitlerinema sp. P-1104]|uniref:putative bifunctional diguanylate cyclase/phosphodiesterase n=1 Tax=Geitlerinema sp. P-1104 TaxID=2546230 RepID=UPI001477095C|nr:EAL domain-containing response regulator [Geitlerinema sp. P-1104]NMG60508.1 GGDEF domain-containing response regulator [Geitlerinema sp. P-1104]